MNINQLILLILTGMGGAQWEQEPSAGGNRVCRVERMEENR